MDINVVRLREKNIPLSTIKEKVVRLYTIKNLDLYGLSDEEKTFYRKVHRYFSSIEDYLAYLLRNRNNKRSDMSREMNSILKTFVTKVDSIV